MQMSGNNKNAQNELLGRVFSAAKRIYRQLGPGHTEAVYHAAMIHELRRLRVRVRDRPALKVMYQGLTVGKYFPDCIVSIPGAAVIVDFKAAGDDEKPFAQADFDQMRRYLGAYNRRALGLLLNFGGKHPVWRRVERYGKIQVDVVEINPEVET